ncbi:acyltransferase [Dyella halodurans]
MGVVAVVSFLLLSGFVMTALISRNFASLDRVRLFYADRVMRLFPQYLFYLALTLAVDLWLGPVTSYTQGITAFKVAMNALMLPLAFYQFGLSDCLIVPPAWTLGLECTFYAIIPFLLIYKCRSIAFAISVVVFLLAYLSVINTDIWGYRLLPGVLFIFLTGSLIYEQASTRRAIALLAIWLGMSALLLGLLRIDAAKAPWNREVLLGMIVGLPAVLALSRRKSGSIDALLGNLSYGVFLNHTVIVTIFKASGSDISRPASAAAIIAVSIVMSYITFTLVEKPVISLRRSIRYKPSPDVTGALATLQATPSDRPD